MSWSLGMIQVVVGILLQSGKVLVAERPPGKPYAGYWEFPGGKIEATETAEVALKRELFEELGVEVLAAKHWFDHVHHYPDKTVHLALWIVDQFQDEPQNKEAQILRWVDFQELLSLRLLEGNRFIIDQLQTLFT